MIKLLKITLESDLCVGSGYSYAGIVDSDCCYDHYGLPYIPARRLKGCLREAASLIGVDAGIFGEWGQDAVLQNTPVRIDNAYLPEREELIRACRQEGELLTRERVLDQFTRIKAQTRINENGVAQPSSLRFTRIVNQYSPLGHNKKQEFYAKVEVADRYAELLKKAVKALRHIGYDRNRGLGSVSCVLLDAPRTSRLDVKTDQITDEEVQGILRYQIRTAAPLVLSQSNADDTEKYISGQIVLGYFASRYLRKYGSADERFESLFLKNQVCFSPLYPSGENGEEYVPAPAYICELKKSKILVNVSVAAPGRDDARYGEQADNGKYYPANGNQPKKLTGGFAALRDGKVALREVETQIVYHHRHASDQDEEQLYAVESIREGQYFDGRITGRLGDLRIMAELLEKGTMSLGKSRSAQYGLCEITRVSLQPVRPDVLTVGQGQSILVTLRSDAIFLDEAKADYTVDAGTVRRQIAQSLVPDGTPEEVFDSAEDAYTEIRVGELQGHYGVWNLRRQSVPCVRAGSTFAYKLKRELTIDRTRAQAGIRRGEGYGSLTITLKSDAWVLEKAQAPMARTAGGIAEHSVAYTLCSKVKYEELKEQLDTQALAAGGIGLSASAVGRLTLMLQECCNENDNAAQIRAALGRRINSIKGDNGDKAQKAKKFVEKYYDGALKSVEPSEFQYITEEQREEMKLYCLKQALVILKYRKKEDQHE